MRMLTIAILCGIGVLQGADSHRTVTVSVRYDPNIREFTILRATSLASRMFARIGTTVRFRFCRQDPHHQDDGLHLDVYVRMDAPPGAAPTALGHSRPFRPDGRIEIFYSRLQSYEPDLSRSSLLGYVIAHEIAHVLERRDGHSPTGVMKAKWSWWDLGKIRTNTLQFDPIDVQLIQDGM